MPKYTYPNLDQTQERAAVFDNFGLLNRMQGNNLKALENIKVNPSEGLRRKKKLGKEQLELSTPIMLHH